jgi:hypothetical protein
VAWLPVCALGAFLNRNEYPAAHWTGPGIRLQLNLEVYAFAVGTVLEHGDQDKGGGISVVDERKAKTYNASIVAIMAAILTANT